MVRCEFRLAGRRCADDTGLPHGHWFRPDQHDEHLHLTREEAAELVSVLWDAYVNPNKTPHLGALLNRLKDCL